MQGEPGGLKAQRGAGGGEGPPEQQLSASRSRIELEALPALVVEPASPLWGAVFALLGIGALAAGVVIGVQNWHTGSHVGAVCGGGVFVASAALLLHIANGMFASRRLAIGEHAVECERRSLWSTHRWRVPHAAYRGIQRRRFRTARRFGGATTHDVIELVHREPRYSVRLVHALGGRCPEPQLAQWTADYAARLGLSMVEPERSAWGRLPMVVRWRNADPWPYAWNPGVGHRALGAGSQQPISWYWTGASTVGVDDAESAVAWLAGCRYIPGGEGRGSTPWQHPCDFEATRCGGCEDHALWAWRRLVELDLEARFYVGLYAAEGRAASRHAWVVLGGGDHQQLITCTGTDAQPSIRSLAGVRERYCPFYSIGRDLKLRTHRGQAWRHFGWTWARDGGWPNS